MVRSFEQPGRLSSRRVSHRVPLVVAESCQFSGGVRLLGLVSLRQRFQTMLLKWLAVGVAAGWDPLPPGPGPPRLSTSARQAELHERR